MRVSRTTSFFSSLLTRTRVLAGCGTNGHDDLAALDLWYEYIQVQMFAFHHFVSQSLPQTAKPVTDGLFPFTSHRRLVS